MRLGFALTAVVILSVAFVFHERRSILEHQLGSVATQLAGRHVRVHCQSLAGNLVDVTAEAGTVWFDTNGKPADVTNLKRPICEALRRYRHDLNTRAYACVVARADCPAKIFEDVLAVHTLAHEAWHLRGIRTESVTECRALQTTAFAASLFGADPAQAQATASYAFLRLYPNLPDEYRDVDCGNGGPMDIRPTDPLWP